MAPRKKQPMTAQQRKAKQRAKEKESDPVEHRRKEAEAKRVYRAKKAESMTEEEKLIEREKQTLAKRKYREMKKDSISLATTPEEVVKVKMSKNKSRVVQRSYVKVKRYLPESPGSRVRIVKRLADTYIPSLVQPSAVRRLRLGLSKDVIDAIIAYYHSTFVSYEAPGKKDLIILRERMPGLSQNSHAISQPFFRGIFTHS